MEHLSRIESGCFNTHSLAGVIHQIVISDDYNSFNTHSLAGVIQTFTKSEIKKSCKFCQIAKCSTFIITDL